MLPYAQRCAKDAPHHAAHARDAAFTQRYEGLRLQQSLCILTNHNDAAIAVYFTDCHCPPFDALFFAFHFFLRSAHLPAHDAAHLPAFFFFFFFFCAMPRYDASIYRRFEARHARAIMLMRRLLCARDDAERVRRRRVSCVRVPTMPPMKLPANTTPDAAMLFSLPYLSYFIYATSI